jgi:transcriptional regulator with XRE-family HTH domain
MSAIRLAVNFLDMTKLPERLRTLRSTRNLTQTRLAELLDINPRVYNRWEQGVSVPHIDTVVKIADILQVNLDELLGRTPITSKPLVRNPKLVEMYQELDHLSDEEQQAVIVLIDSLIKRAKFNEILNK